MIMETTKRSSLASPESKPGNPARRGPSIQAQWPLQKMKMQATGPKDCHGTKRYQKHRTLARGNEPNLNGGRKKLDKARATFGNPFDNSPGQTRKAPHSMEIYMDHVLHHFNCVIRCPCLFQVPMVVAWVLAFPSAVTTSLSRPAGGYFWAKPPLLRSFQDPGLLKNTPHQQAELSWVSVWFELRPFWPLIVLTILHSKKTAEEIWQYFGIVQDARPKGLKRLFADLFEPENVADIAYIIIGWVAIVWGLTRRSFPTWDPFPFMSIFCLLSWLKLLYGFRGESWIGPRLLPIFSALSASLGFFFVVAIAVAGSAHAYYDLRRRTTDPSDPLFDVYTALLQTGRLGIFGDFDLFEFEGLDPILKNTEPSIYEPEDPSPGQYYIWVHLLFWATGVAITVLLMNLLIGILSTDFERYEAKASELFYRARAKMMVELRTRPTSILMQYLWDWWLRQCSKWDEPDFNGCSRNIPEVLRCGAFPLRLVLGRLAFEEIVHQPFKHLAHRSDCVQRTLLLLCWPFIFVAQPHKYSARALCF